MRWLPYVSLLLVACGTPAYVRPPPPSAHVLSPPAPASVAHGPALEALAALVHEHRPSAPPSDDAGQPFSIPVDWRTLPLTAELAPVPRHDAVLVGDLVATSDAHGVDAWDARTGEGRWHVDVQYGEVPYLLATCGRVIALAPSGLHGIDATSGEIAWTIPLDVPPTVLDQTPRGGIRARDCHVVFQVDDRRMAPTDPYHSGRLRIVDAATGAITARPEWSSVCAVRDLGDTGVVVSLGGACVLQPYDGAAPTPLPACSAFLTETTVLVIGQDGEVQGLDRATGAERWRGHVDVRHRIGGGPPIVLAHPASDVVWLDGEALVRVSIDDGHEVWRIALSRELASLLARHDGRDSDAHRLVIGSRAVPQILLDVDLDLGRPRSLRSSSVDPVDIDLAGDLVRIASYHRQAIVDLGLDAPALRERFSLDDDIERTIAQLSSEGRRSSEVSPWNYPTDRGTALEWLARLRPITGDVIGARIATADVTTAAAMLGALESTETALATTLDVLHRTYGPPEATVAAARTRVLASLHAAISASEAEQLGVETLAWLEVVMAHAETAADDAIWQAILAGRDALLRCSPTRAPLDAIESAIRQHAPTPALADCAPSEDDAIRAATLRNGYELGIAPGATILVPGSTCIRVSTLGGALAVRDASETEERPYVIVHPPTALERDESFPFPDLPARSVYFMWYRGDLAAEGHLATVQLVDGLWRVVEEHMTWVS